jgi:CBS domain-containing protein
MTMRAADIMSRNVVTAGPDEAIISIAKRMVEHGISAVPICDAEHHLIGIVSEGDLMRPLRQSALQKRARWLDLLAEGDNLSEDFISYLKSSNRHVRDLMTAKVITASEDASPSEIAELMVSNQVRHIPVVHKGAIVGIVSRTDIVRAIARGGDIEG